jgi:cytochrome c peroxidase
MPVYIGALARLDHSLARLDASLERRDDDDVRRSFRAARAMYKRLELFAEYYGESDVRALNGVPLPKAEDEDPEAPLPPIGLQVVEGIVFPALDTARVVEARTLMGYMRTAVASLKRAGADSMPGDSYLFDAIRQEISRVGTLGIAGFDTGPSGDAIVESAEAFEGVREALEPYRAALMRRAPAETARLDVALAHAIAALRSHPDFDSFDRLAFITREVIPTARALAEAQRTLGIAAPDRPRAWSARSASLFEPNALDPYFFASTDATRDDTALVSLGRELFFDPVLSADGTRSCASCHQPARAFTDGRARAELVGGKRAGSRTRNTPTLLNAALQPTQFADNRARTLEDQAADVVGNGSEMGGTLVTAAVAVSRRPAYRLRFSRAFGAAPDTSVSARALRLAVAAYVRSLVAMDSPFDRALAGDTNAMGANAREGFNLFMGRARCGTCHFAPLFNGALPPKLVENEPEVIGVPARDVRRHASIDPDSGRFNVRRIEQHLHAFKTPTLRNVARTAPYMHNGAFATLESVVDFYDAGGGAGIGARLAHQTLPPDSLHLSAAQKKAIIAFLHTLTNR